MQKTILLLGSGELGKEFAIAMARLGQTVVAVDSYDGAPAQQVTPYREVIPMLDGDRLDAVVAKYRPSIIVPEIEAIRTERLFDYEASGIQVVPSANAANATMNRKTIRELAAKKLGLPTAPYRYATSLVELTAAANELGYPCVVKPLMSSSGKGQSVVNSSSELKTAWESASTKGRGDYEEVIVEGFVEFDSEITLLTVTQKEADTLICPPIGHVQERGDYMESWTPADISATHLHHAHEMAWQVTKELSGQGIWGVEFFITPGGVVFSELSPRPHDTGMVTLANCLPLNEFELHARAVLGLPIPPLDLIQYAASAVILSDFESHTVPNYEGVANALSDSSVDIRIFGKPSTRIHRRMGVALARGPLGEPIDQIRKRARLAASTVRVVPN